MNSGILGLSTNHGMRGFPLSRVAPKELIFTSLIYASSSIYILQMPQSADGYLHIQLWGASGGGYAGGGGGGSSKAGGGGGYTAATMSIAPFKTIEVLVGGLGLMADSAVSAIVSGGLGGGGIGRADSFGWQAGAGGGRSAIRIDGEDVLTAGGGGGASFSNNLSRLGGGGGLTGSRDEATTGAATGGTQTAGGAAGTGGVNNGQVGSKYKGGDGQASYGGGGGGGWYGGGSGGTDGGNVKGGGGGSSYTGSTTINAVTIPAGIGGIAGGIEFIPTDIVDDTNNGSGNVGSAGNNGLIILSWKAYV